MHNAELDHGSHGLTWMGTKLGFRGDARPPWPWNPRQPWLHFAESGLRHVDYGTHQMRNTEPPMKHGLNTDG
jgi:hypothetical protein